MASGKEKLVESLNDLNRNIRKDTSYVLAYAVACGIAVAGIMSKSFDIGRSLEHREVTKILIDAEEQLNKEEK